MREEMVKIYKFDELSNEVQEKVIRRFRESDNYLDYAWYDYTMEQYVNKARTQGIDNAEFSFSGFWSQGDGAGISKGDIDIEKALEVFGITFAHDASRKVFLQQVETSCYRVKRGNYTDSAFSVDYYGTGYNKLDSYLETKADQLATRINDATESLTSALYNDLEKEYEYLMSDESITENIIANDYEFLADGTMW